MKCIKIFEEYFEMINEAIHSNIKVLKDYLLKPYKEKEKEFKILFPNKNYDGTPTKEDYELAKSDGEFKTIRKDTKGKDKVVNREYPTHYYFTYLNDIPKERWIIHFSDNAYNIFNDQEFKYGMKDYRYLGYTNRYSNIGKMEGGYNFGYLFSDAVKYGLNNNPKSIIKLDNSKEDDKNKSHYGKYLVIFRANGIKVKSWVNDENQVIFWGKDATNINLVTNENGKWSIKSRKKTININFFKSFWEQYIKPYNRNRLEFDQKLFDYKNIFQFNNINDVFTFFERDYEKYKEYIY